MNLTLKIATINTNGISANIKMHMLKDFIQRQDIDITLLQEITNSNFPPMYGYDMYFNEGTDKRGTAIFSKSELTMTNIKRLPSGRGIAALLEDTWIINIYAPSGSE